MLSVAESNISDNITSMSSHLGMKINRKLILGVVLLLLVALILYFINRRNSRETFYQIVDNNLVFNPSTFQELTNNINGRPNGLNEDIYI